MSQFLSDHLVPLAKDENPNPRTMVSTSCHAPSDLQKDESTGSGQLTLTISNDATIIREIPEEDGNSISGVLRYCKRLILYPYLKLLGVMGLKPCAEDMCICSRVLNKLWVLVVILLIFTGYVLQFLTCFRRDYGFNYRAEVSNSNNEHDTDNSHLIDKKIFSANKTHLHDLGTRFHVLPTHHWETTTDATPKADVKHDLIFHSICEGNSFYVHFIPSFLHSIAIGYMIFLYWLNHDEQLQNLMERVFIQATQAQSIHISQKRVLKPLKFLVFFGTSWLLFSTGCLVVQIVFSHIRVNFWPQLGYTELRTLASVMGFLTCFQDAIQVTVIISYCIHCHLLSIYLDFIHNRISQHSITLPDCIKEIGEIEKLLRYINTELASGILPLIMRDTMICIGCVVVLVANDPASRPYIMLNACFALFQWLFLVALPLIQGAKLSTSLKKVRELGHIVRMRPFGYQNYQQTDLDSFLLFVSTLKMDVRIMKLPLTATNISMLICMTTFLVFLWGYFQ